MGINNNIMDWLHEAEQPSAGQAPTSDPYARIVGATQPPDQGAGPPQPSDQPQQQQDNVEDDPSMPEADPKATQPQDFEQWRHDFLELSIKGDVEEMLSSINHIRSVEGLEFSQKKFIEDNFQILLYRQDPAIAKATKEIRNLIKQDLDRTNPGTTVMQHIAAALEKDPILSQVFIKLGGMYGLKGELHRKFIAAITGSVQVGVGASREDLIYCEKEYTINLSTRFATQFGEINLGKWSLKSDDPQRYLTEPELDRLNDGAPEEKQTLRRRIILESIGDKFKQRAFIINIVSTDGTVHYLGWDLGDSLLAAYKEGKVIVRGKQNESKDAMISDTGDIITLVDVDIVFVRETGEVDEDGKPEMVEVPFLTRRDSVLYLDADLDTLKTAASSLSGMFFNASPYNGNPEELDTIARCIPSLSEMLGRRC
jgi:hypothetical protein